MVSAGHQNLTIQNYKVEGNFSFQQFNVSAKVDKVFKRIEVDGKKYLILDRANYTYEHESAHVLVDNRECLPSKKSPT